MPAEDADPLMRDDQQQSAQPFCSATAKQKGRILPRRQGRKTPCEPRYYLGLCRLAFLRRGAMNFSFSDSQDAEDTES